MKKYTAIFLILIITCCILTACNSNSTVNQQNNIEAETEEQTTTIAEEVAEVAEESTPEPTEEPTPEPTTEPVEMVSWEEWASQPGEEEPHLVVWNEERGKQLIIEPYDTYTLEEGDKLAVSASLSYENTLEMSPTRVESVETGNVTKQELVQTEYGQYDEVVIEEKGTNYVYYSFKDVGYNYFIENP